MEKVDQAFSDEKRARRKGKKRESYSGIKKSPEIMCRDIKIR